MFTRREALQTTALLGVSTAWPSLVLGAEAKEDEVEVNDVQSQLNPTRVNRVVAPRSVEAIQAVLREARRENRAVSVAGGRHAMGGQQFGVDSVLLDMKKFNRVLGFDKQRGLVEVEGGFEWPELIEYLSREQVGQDKAWSIRQKQTGVDRVSIGGSLASNIHGRGLRWGPFIEDVESFAIVDAAGKLHNCSRRENHELFTLAIGGYGLFGVIAHVTLRLVPRTKLRRVVELIVVKDLLPLVEKRIEQGCVYGDCQYSTDLESDAQSHPGVFSCYQSVDLGTPIPDDQKQLSAKDWAELYVLARTDKQQAFKKYSEYYLGTSGQVYWSDTQQLAGALSGYREAADKRPDKSRGTEMITEVYVTKKNFLPFMAQVRQDYLDHKVDMTYGTIRFIEKDAESFLAWAREPSVCIVCNLHVVHTKAGQAKAAEDFRRIIERAIEYGGRYYLTYHRFATRKQVETCYPRFVEFLRLKKKYDPLERFQSDWYRHYKALFADKL